MVYKANNNQQGFTKSKLTDTNEAIYLRFITPLLGNQRQAGAFYVDISSAFDLTPHSLLLHEVHSFWVTGAREATSCAATR
jgi:hypothetical protein